MSTSKNSFIILYVMVNRNRTFYKHTKTVNWLKQWQIVLTRKSLK